MKSPFPGMDPFLEDHWRDVHTRLMNLFCDGLQHQLPSDLVARMEEEITIDADLPGPASHFRPDVQVSESWEGGDGGGVATMEATVAEPILYRGAGPQRARHLEILDFSTGGRLVTAIEIISPSNKLPGAGRGSYLRKRSAYMDGGANVVEIDLIRGGNSVIAIEPADIPPARRALYCACVWRAAKDRHEVYPLRLRERLPAIRIPLRPTDRDVVLDLQALIDEAYLRGRYDRIDYASRLNPPLAESDAKWAAGLLSEAGRK